MIYLLASSCCETHQFTAKTQSTQRNFSGILCDLCAFAVVFVCFATETSYDVLTTVRLGREEWQENKAFCIYCQTATVTTLASALLDIPEVRQAINNIRGQQQLQGQQQSPHAFPQTAPRRWQASVFA